ncbi:outer membrane beta-barrel domain-containing protein [Marinimicrobium agarilyticum]|uniref:outer membrane beta-barrel domain-containing protein n=1 Tax=Marinimicrobium agarilyticum TaxID=306546 RepID=UPI00041AA4F6|nr:outer membrane beta-barrel domain-containing protein [Marinimicrobium agarilyticum]
MANRFQRLLLGLALAGSAPLAVAQDDGPLGDIVGPDEERRSLSERDLDTENFEFGVFYGLMSVEDFGSNDIAGASLSYHVSEDFFLQANYGITETRETSYELLSGAVELLTEDQREYTYYNLSLGYNFLPGQIYLSENWSFNTSAYVIGGAGNTEFAGQEYFTYNLGAGFKLFATDWLAFDLGMRGHVFTHELFGREVEVNNLEARLGVSVFF